ncbi:hypothetical protein F5146DRAFT_997635 [Armillaria mellea]|nr:hypothetical protein F5146DRAFT_997635 [Armillaria mellea]
MALLESKAESLPDARTLQNRAKSRTYYSRNREQILANLAEKYRRSKKPGDAPKQRTSERKSAHARNSAQSYQRSSADTHDGSTTKPVRDKAQKDGLACPPLQSMSVQSNSGNLQFWLRRGKTLKGRLATLLDRRIRTDLNTGMCDLNNVEAYDCLKAQYIERVYREFRFLFKHDGTYNHNEDSVFEPRVEEMEELSIHATHCADAILNIEGYSENYKRIDSLAAEVTTVGGWIAELEIEVMNDPKDLIRLHREHKLMYQM